MISQGDHEVNEARCIAKDLGVEHVPSTVIRGKKNRPVRFLRVPTGAQLVVFVETLIEASRDSGKLTRKVSAKSAK